MKASIKFSIGIGKDQDGNKITMKHALEAGEKIKALVAKLFGGYSANLCSGGWYSEALNTLVEELALQIEAAVTEEAEDTGANIYAVCALAKSLLNQECVLVTIYEGKSSFI